MYRTMCKSKIHRATVTGADLNYMGSITIDPELMEAAENRGGAVKRRDEVHRMAEANKAFSHFRF